MNCTTSNFSHFILNVCVYTNKGNLLPHFGLASIFLWHQMLHISSVCSLCLRERYGFHFPFAPFTFTTRSLSVAHFLIELISLHINDMNTNSTDISTSNESHGFCRCCCCWFSDRNCYGSITHNHSQLTGNEMVK